MNQLRISPAAPPRRLAAVLFADIVGFTRLTAVDDARAFRIANILQESARRCIVEGGGRVVRFVGDSVLSEFPSAESAVRSAFALQREFAREAEKEQTAGELRIGVHVGELTEASDGDIYGDSVNMAARLQAEAAPQQVLVSDDVWRQLRGRGGFSFEHQGVRSLKGISERVTVHAVRERLSTDSAMDPVMTTHPIPPATQEPAATRLIVLPFRALRPDPEIDFLSFGLADAITATLSGLRSLVVRSSLVAQRYASESPDLRVVGRDAAVDLVLTGTLLRAADRVRVTAQLTDAETGTVLWSESQQVTLGDLFQLQDDLTQRVVSSVATPLTTRERRLIRRDVPATARAYELYLRANQASMQLDQASIARDLYLASLEEDPDYAPAWARLGRCHRLVAKYSGNAVVAEREGARAERAFKRALELNPDLALAHNLYAQYEVERGRPREAMIRLIELAKAAPDAQIFAGLVHALRYCGLFEESVAAHDAARKLDPNIPTSLEFTLLVMGRYEDALRESGSTRGDARGYALASLGRTDEAMRLMDSQLEQYSGPGTDMISALVQSVKLALGGDVPAALKVLLPSIELFPDLEGYFVSCRWMASFGARDECIPLLERVVEGYFCEYPLRHDSWLESLRSHPKFPSIVQRAAEGRSRALTSFLETGGPEVLEIS